MLPFFVGLTWPFVFYRNDSAGGSMRTITIAVLVPVLAGSMAWAAPSPKGKGAPAPRGPQVYYFEFNSDLVGEVQTEATLKETRDGNRVTSAVLDVCFSVSPTSNRKERFVVTLAPEGTNLVGSGTTQEGKAPVSVRLTRRVSGKTFSFGGSIARGSITTTVALPEQSDMT